MYVHAATDRNARIAPLRNANVQRCFSARLLQSFRCSELAIGIVQTPPSNVRKKQSMEIRLSEIVAEKKNKSIVL